MTLHKLTFKQKIIFLGGAFVTGIFMAFQIDPTNIAFNSISTWIPDLIKYSLIIYALIQIRDLMALVRNLSNVSYFFAFCAGLVIRTNPDSIGWLIILALFFTFFPV